MAWAHLSQLKLHTWKVKKSLAPPSGRHTYFLDRKGIHIYMIVSIILIRMLTPILESPMCKLSGFSVMMILMDMYG